MLDVSNSESLSVASHQVQVQSDIVELRHVISNNVAMTSIDSDEPLQPPFKLRNPK